MGYKGRGEMIFVEAICSKDLRSSSEVIEGNVEKILIMKLHCCKHQIS